MKILGPHQCWIRTGKNILNVHFKQISDIIFMQMKFANHWYKQREVVDEFWLRIRQDKRSVFVCQAGIEDGLEEGRKLDSLWKTPGREPCNCPNGKVDLFVPAWKEMKISTRNMMNYYESTTRKEGIKGDCKLWRLDDVAHLTVGITAEEDSGSCCL